MRSRFRTSSAIAEPESAIARLFVRPLRYLQSSARLIVDRPIVYEIASQNFCGVRSYC
ncbi:MAG: hypothetical protein HC936_00400 [Leptolyngbyaceae cyanobacterium SU_3_3]|nr:hypothetical protein [Leptolyngbyaceae cyanobacterium SU_3_3]